MQMMYHTLTSDIKNYFFPSAVIEGNKLDSRLRKVKSFTDFKKNILSFMRPKANSVFKIATSSRVKSLKRTQIQAQFPRFYKSTLLL